MTAYVESWITREMTIARFSATKTNGHFAPFNLRYFLDLTVFTLLSHKGKISVILPPCLHSILNMFNVSTSSFTYSCIKAELVKLCSRLISPSDSMWAAVVIMWYWTFIVFTQLPRWLRCFFSRIVYILTVHKFQNKIHHSFDKCEKI